MFWNIMKSMDVISLIPQLCNEKDIDIVILCELGAIETEYIERRLRETEKNYLVELPLPNNRTYLFHNKKQGIGKVGDGRFYSAFKILDKSSPILLVSLHLPSRLYKTESNIGAHAARIKREIEELEKELNTNKTIVVGDFNLNPFSEGMTSSDGLHAIMDKEIAMKLKRKVDGEFCKYFFNPMWSLHGNMDKNVLGTYFHHKSQTSYVWNMFDQVIIRPQLIERFDFESLEIIHMINETPILNKQGRPNKESFSDHLPLKFTILLEE
ncbi:hypothetical protein P4647_08275 [Peribacillus frigoritolerans]|uniref:endonuclease/exonuclease/phosphatase family protein n=1 Tax=Peribacillus frigoritolerans TaxID=450367 RepID=UPI002E231C7D|nr:hypothetical protein [Peribacillus frigoritolerans]